MKHLGNRFLLITAMMAASCAINAQEKRNGVRGLAEQRLAERGEVIIRFIKPGDLGMDYLADFLSIDAVKQDTVTAYANIAGFMKFLSEDVPYEVLDPPSLKKRMHNPSEKSAGWHNRYPSYPEYLALMDSFAGRYPQLSRLVDIGRSTDDRRLLVMKISRNPGIRENEPAVLLTSTIHGDEPLGISIMLRLIEELLGQYETDVRIGMLVDSVEIWINPLANPDGTYFLSDESVTGATRFNAASTDLNRDFPDPRDNDWESSERQPETTAMMDFMKNLHLVLAVNFHGGAEVVNYPWETWPRLHADDAWYRELSRMYADTVHAHGPPDYMTDLDNGITNGYAWYPVFGGRQDYVNYFLFAREVTIELSHNKMPDETSLEDFWNYNKRSLLQYIGQVFTGIRGHVTDSVTGLPVRAIISIPEHDKDNSQVYSDSATGVFFRLTGPGSYELTCTAPGYRRRKLRIAIERDRLSRVEIALSPMTPGFVFPNPFSDILYFNVDEPGGQLLLEFFDLSGRKAGQISQTVTEAGDQEIDTRDIPPGLYLARMTQNGRGTRQVLLKLEK